MDTGYAQPAPQRGSSLGAVMDYIHGMFSVGGAQAAENPQLPQRAAPAQPDQFSTEPRRPMTGYNVGGYGGELTSPTPEARGTGIAGRGDGQADAGAAVAAVAGAAVDLGPGHAAGRGGAGRLLSGADAGGAGSSPQSRRADIGTQRVGPDHQSPPCWGRAAQRRIGERELYGGTSFGASDTWNPAGNQPVWTGIRNTLEGLIGGDHPKTPAETLKVLDTITQNPQADHNPMVQKTFDELGRKGGVDGQANFVQSLRPTYDRYMGIGQAALSQGRTRYGDAVLRTGAQPAAERTQAELPARPQGWRHHRYGAAGRPRWRAADGGAADSGSSSTTSAPGRPRSSIMSASSGSRRACRSWLHLRRTSGSHPARPAAAFWPVLAGRQRRSVASVRIVRPVP